MAQEKSNSGNKDGELHSLITLAVIFAGIILITKFGPTLRYWVREHLFSLGIISAVLGWGLLKAAIWKWRRKNPDKHRRKLLLNFMEKLREKPGSIFIGKTLKEKKLIFLSPQLRVGHVQILGATGRGKTASVIMPWFLRDLRNGTVPILLDGKGDASIVYEMMPEAGRAGHSIYHFDPAAPEASCRINPLEGGSAHEIADRLFASLEFESSYFREIQYSATLTCLEVFEYLRETTTLKRLFEALSNPQTLLDRMPAEQKAHDQLTLNLMKICQMKSEDREEKFSGILSQLRPFSSGAFEKLVNSEGRGAHINLDDVMNPKKAREQGISGFVILLPTMQYQKTAKVLGKLILQALAWSAARRNENQEMTPLFIDEFSAFVYEGFEQFLNKARSKGVALHLSHQSMGDLESVSPSFAKTVNVNTNVKVLLGLNDPDTADYFARHLGTFTSTKETERASRGLWGERTKSGDMSIRAVEEYKIHPNHLKAFTRGQGVLSLIVDGRPLAEEVQFDSNKSL